MPQLYPQRTTVQEATDYVIRILGAGAGNPVKQAGDGVVVTYQASAGLYRIQWAENPFQFIGAFASFIASTPLNVAGWTANFDDYDATNFRLDFLVTNGANAAADLTSTMRLCINAKFARTGY